MLEPAPIAQTDSDNMQGAQNMLSPIGIPWSAWVKEEWEPGDALPMWATEAAYPCQLAGMTLVCHLPIFQPEGCLPDSVGTLIATDKGVRQLQIEELA